MSSTEQQAPGIWRTDLQRHDLLCKEIFMSAASTRLPPAEGLGSVSQAPHLPEGFNDTFTGRYIDDTGEVRFHAVIGGDGHWLAEEAPEEILTAFLAPYREGGGGLR